MSIPVLPSMPNVPSFRDIFQFINKSTGKINNVFSYLMSLKEKITNHIQYIKDSNQPKKTILISLWVLFFMIMYILLFSLSKILSPFFFIFTIFGILLSILFSLIDFIVVITEFGAQLLELLGAAGLEAAAVEAAIASEVPPAVEAAVAEAVPTAVEAAVAEAVPTAVAEAVGTAVGEAVPPAVAEAVGTAVPPSVAEAVGTAVPPAVAEAVGTAVPPAVAEAVGTAVPPAVAEAVGIAIESALPIATAAAVESAVATAVPTAIATAVPTAVASAVTAAVPAAVASAIPTAVAATLTTEFLTNLFDNKGYVTIDQIKDALSTKNGGFTADLKEIIYEQLIRVLQNDLDEPNIFTRANITQDLRNNLNTFVSDISNNQIKSYVNSQETSDKISSVINSSLQNSSSDTYKKIQSISNGVVNNYIRYQPVPKAYNKESFNYSYLNKDVKKNNYSLYSY